MEIFVMCPFCMKVFDSIKEPHFTFRVDNHVRVAHVSCFEAMIARNTVPAVAVPAPVAIKPNGEVHS